MKKTICILTLLMAFALPLSLISCHQKEEYSDSISADRLADEITRALADDGVYLTDDQGLTDSYFTLPESVSEHTVRYTSDTNNINEFGVYHVTRGGAKELEAMLVEKYLEAAYLNNREWYDSYIPNEASKLRDAEVRTLGNYVVYAILDKKDRDTVFDTVEDILEQ